MNLHNALFNWLQVKLLSDGLPEDDAAKETLAFFEEVLREDHGLQGFEIATVDETMIHVRYVTDGSVKLQMFNREAAAKLLSDIQSDAKSGC